MFRKLFCKMGCNKNRSGASVIGNIVMTAPSMGVVPEFPGPPKTDDRLPLNARQTYLLKASWKGIRRNMEATGLEMFLR